ncbi:16S rRNA (cytidine(1402)-2'-O)-methyltransferase [Geochorda subterranea]|uniref:Ribosomal RNA small subunit methyltransferase I n=1 Tax=Geochorda subterranea TaxID=3109564 RepID=A0ABZ1BN84_9FIRM|nr:16S rRNA (cytidine(1402)-2'-O)-methyltransferase [Limnochorda sp. LNt]WRP14252.1 16S rRNA (cytidine(1402)-2'-O)-methyltransferase [Limnochorda sp. LNt]
MSGTLWVCATPIGNLQDVSLRLLETLQRVDLIAAEDTRRTLKLLNAHGIRRPLVSFHEHNARQRLPELLARLHAGQSVALVTDAGTPVVSDPGADLVRAAHEAGVAVRVIPGASAVVAALAVAGLPAEPFWFEGFLPARRRARLRRLEWLRALPATLVFFEAPHRLGESLADMAAVLGDREAALARELTKVHESVVRDTLSGLARRVEQGEVPAVGELTLVVAPPAPGSPEPGPSGEPGSD